MKIAANYKPVAKSYTEILQYRIDPLYIVSEESEEDVEYDEEGNPVLLTSERRGPTPRERRAAEKEAERKRRKDAETQRISCSFPGSRGEFDI